MIKQAFNSKFQTEGLTQKMIVEFAEGADEKKTMKAVLKACKKVEPDCEIEL